MTKPTIPVQYDRFGRMKYHPDFHSKHKTAWTYADEKYLIERYAIDGPEDVSLVLERTIGVVMTRANLLRKQGKMPKFLPGTKHHTRSRNL